MLDLKLALHQYELDHDTRYQSQCDRCHKDEIIRTCSLLYVLKRLINRIRCRSDIEGEIWIIGRHSQDGLVHVLGEHGRDILGGHVQVVDDLVEGVLLVRVVDLVRAVSVRVQRKIISGLIYLIVEISVIRRIDILHIEGLSHIWHVRKELRALHIVAVAHRVDRILIH